MAEKLLSRAEIERFQALANGTTDRSHIALPATDAKALIATAIAAHELADQLAQQVRRKETAREVLHEELRSKTRDELIERLADEIAATCYWLTRCERLEVALEKSP